MTDGAVRIVDPLGREVSASVVPKIPADLEVGEFLTLPSQSGRLFWYLFCNKSRSWDGSTWKLGGTLVQFEAGIMSEKEIYAFRRKMLKWAGHL